MGKAAPSAAQTIAQAKKNLAEMHPDNKSHPAIVKGRPKPRQHDDKGGLVDQYKKAIGSPMW